IPSRSASSNAGQSGWARTSCSSILGRRSGRGSSRRVFLIPRERASMPDRSLFWSPVPDWPQAVILHRDLNIAVASSKAVWMVSGDLAKFLSQRGGLPCLGPREMCKTATYAFRLAPDRLLFVSNDEGAIRHAAFGWSDGIGATDVSDGFVLFDV